MGVTTENGVAESKHKAVTRDGRSVIVDFKMGGKIMKISSGKMVLYCYDECPGNPGRAGAWVCDGPQKKSASYKVNEVQFTDDDGKDQAFMTPDGPGPIADKVCQDHGSPPPPTELSPAELLAWREEQADKLMDQADTLWASEKAADRRKAQTIYQKLLSSFIDLESVKSRNSELTERSKKKIADGQDPASRVPRLPLEENLNRAAEAARLLSEADALWESVDPTDLKKAQLKYKHLLDHHAGNPAVIRRRAELSHRSRQRVD